MTLARKRHARAIMAVQGNTLHPRDLVICFTDKDYKGTPLHQDDPMVISLIAEDYNIERVLKDQGSSANIPKVETSHLQSKGVLWNLVRICNATIVQERDKDQQSVYFNNYVVVRTDLTIKKVLRKPNLVRRMGHIEAQTLANFMTKLALIDQGHQIVKEAERVSFWKALMEYRSSYHYACNNQAEYEALLVRMELERELGAQILIAKSDFKLVTSQVNKDYQARDP
ncbi:hypothetical protein CR513_05057, partial [Mucuna pruriens]